MRTLATLITAIGMVILTFLFTQGILPGFGHQDWGPVSFTVRRTEQQLFSHSEEYTAHFVTTTAFAYCRDTAGNVHIPVGQKNVRNAGEDVYVDLIGVQVCADPLTRPLTLAFPMRLPEGIPVNLHVSQNRREGVYRVTAENGRVLIEEVRRSPWVKVPAGTLPHRPAPYAPETL
jgi:hypothetical protein